MYDPHLASFSALEPGRTSRTQPPKWCAAPAIVRFNANRTLRERLRSEHGAATAEYAITTLAAVGFAGLLVVVLRSAEVRTMLTDIVRNALSIPS